MLIIISQGLSDIDLHSIKLLFGWGNIISFFSGKNGNSSFLLYYHIDDNFFQL